MFRKLALGASITGVVVASVTWGFLHNLHYASVAAQPVAVTNPITSGAVEAAINGYRVQNGLLALSDNSLLDASAKSRADYLCQSNNWSHDGWTDSITYIYQSAGENLAEGFKDVPTLMSGWVHSPEHLVNIVNPKWQVQGVGVTVCPHYQNQVNQIIVVNHFAQPRF